MTPEQVQSEHDTLHAMWTKNILTRVRPGDFFHIDHGTVRRCVDCDRFIAGGPTRCHDCVRAMEAT